MGWAIADVYPPVNVLPVHLPGRQIHRLPTNEPSAVLDEDSMLIAYFQACVDYPAKTRDLLYSDMPAKFTFSNKKWKPRVKKVQGLPIGRLDRVSPFDHERFYLRLLLLTIRGATSFDHLKTGLN